MKTLLVHYHSAGMQLQKSASRKIYYGLQRLGPVYRTMIQNTQGYDIARQQTRNRLGSSFEQSE